MNSKFEKAINDVAAAIIAAQHTGRTTRLIDKAIQDIFTKPGEWIEIKDHDSDYNAMWIRLNKRLAMEHRHIYDSSVLEIDKSHDRIRLVMDPKQLDLISQKLLGEDNDGP